MLEDPAVQPHGNSVFSKEAKRKPVAASREFQRIRDIPRRVVTIHDDKITMTYPDGTVKDVPDFTNYFRVRGGFYNLWPIQNAALLEMSKTKGGFFPISVGGGKTLISLLAHEAMFGPVTDFKTGLPGPGSKKRTLLVVKPQLRTQLLLRDMPIYRRHFRIPINNINIVSYSDLSGQKGTDLLHKIRPDLIIADEAHSLRHAGASRTRRFRRFMKDFPDTRVVVLSGTMTKRSLSDYSHLADWSLKGNSPLPIHFYELQEWCEALDVVEGQGEPKPPGALLEFCAPGEKARDGFRRRLIETPGVLASTDSSIDIPIILRRRRVDVPSGIAAKIEQVYAEWAIGEEELADGMAVNRVVRQLATGFHYEWKWPGGVRDAEWLHARRQWMRAMREFLQKTNKPGLDSPMLVENAVRDKRIKGSLAEPLYATYPEWAAIRGRTNPETVPHWLDAFVVKDAVRWGNERLAAREGGLIFYESDALGTAISKVTGWPQYGAGADASECHPTTNPILVCSIQAQGTGKNLQAWNKMLITSPPANGVTTEQLYGRMHRPGQKADHVEINMYLHVEAFEKALDKAFADAEYMQATQGQQQKLLMSELHDITVHASTPNEDIEAALDDETDGEDNDNTDNLNE